MTIMPSSLNDSFAGYSTLVRSDFIVRSILCKSYITLSWPVRFQLDSRNTCKFSRVLLHWLPAAIFKLLIRECSISESSWCLWLLILLECWGIDIHSSPLNLFCFVPAFPEILSSLFIFFLTYSYTVSALAITQVHSCWNPAAGICHYLMSQFQYWKAIQDQVFPKLYLWSIIQSKQERT